MTPIHKLNLTDWYCILGSILMGALIGVAFWAGMSLSDNDGPSDQNTNPTAECMEDGSCRVVFPDGKAFTYCDPTKICAKE